MLAMPTDRTLAPFDEQYAHEVPMQKSSSEHIDSLEILPGYPRILYKHKEILSSFLAREFCSDDMDRISPHLWMMSMQSHTNISPLHRQLIKGRDIVVTEDPKLHLVWIRNRIFVKPLPKYMCSYQFWKSQLSAEEACASRLRIRSNALGYLRTWYYLIQYESDFRIAQQSELQLIPESLNWEDFCDLSARFDKISNASVSGRYHYGELRLRRLNFYTKIFLGKWSYQRVYTEYGEYMQRFYAPVLFIIAILSILLNALQVLMSVEQVTESKWKVVWGISRWCGVLASILVLLVVSALVAILSWKFYAEWRKALNDRFFSRKAKGTVADVEKQR